MELVGRVLVRMILDFGDNMKMWLEEIGTAIILFGLMYIVAIIILSL